MDDDRSEPNQLRPLRQTARVLKGKNGISIGSEFCGQCVREMMNSQTPIYLIPEQKASRPVWTCGMVTRHASSELNCWNRHPGRRYELQLAVLPTCHLYVVCSTCPYVGAELNTTLNVKLPTASVHRLLWVDERRTNLRLAADNEVSH
jgi:hypothetical protein